MTDIEKDAARWNWFKNHVSDLTMACDRPSGGTLTFTMGVAEIANPRTARTLDRAVDFWMCASSQADAAP